jgi:hypothetical protein
MSGCRDRIETDRKVKHIILIGLDAFGSRGFQKAITPHMNEMVAKGAISPFARCLLPTNSSPNWTAMLTGAGPLQHGVYDNDWEIDKQLWPPVMTTEEGVFPSLFNWIGDQIPSAKIHFFYEWGGLPRLFDLREVDSIYHGDNGDTTFKNAMDAFFEKQPDFLFLNIDEIDHFGHHEGHDSEAYFNAITHYDSLIGVFIERLEEANLMEETLIMITGDHGGINKGHGGSSLNEMEIPIILYGKGVNNGLIIDKPCYIYDVPVTLAYALGITPPRAVIGRPILEAFDPESISVPFVPVPLILPTNGYFPEGPVTIEMRVDAKDTEILYALDGSIPSKNSGKVYQNPLIIEENTILTSIAYSNGAYSRPEINHYRIGNGEDGRITWNYYEGAFKQIPDFSLIPLKKSGKSNEFSLEEVPHRADQFAVKFNAKLEISKSGTYTFFTNSDDGSILLIDGKVIVDNGGSHSRQTKSNQIDLSEGFYALEVRYFEDYVGEDLEVFIEGPGIPKQIITNEFIR